MEDIFQNFANFLENIQSHIESLEKNVENPKTGSKQQELELLKEFLFLADSFLCISYCEKCGHLYKDGYLVGKCVCDDREEGDVVKGESFLHLLEE